MTRAELNAIRARVERHDAATLYHAPTDLRALLAEVERLRDAHAMAVQVSGELCEKCGWAMKFPGEKCRCELLAEVERLTAERDTAHGLLFGHTGFLGPCAHERDPWDRCDECGKGTAVEAAAKRVDALQAEVAKLHADPLPAAAWVREVERAAFKRGVSAMREAAIEWAWRNFVLGAMASVVVRDLRALPDPEDKS